MQSVQEQSVLLRVADTSSDQGKSSEGVVTIHEWSEGERLKRAIKSLAACWIAATLSVLIPIGHFILVPALLIAGPIVAYKIYQKERMIMGGSGKCPNCGQDFAIIKSPVRWPINDLCSGCQTRVLVDRP